jgi:hypothetical protein
MVMLYAIAVLALIVAFETWCLWRVLDRLSVVARVEDRLLTLTHTIALLTDTTETCFQAIAGQLDQRPGGVPHEGAVRGMRQRRVVGAARRGRSVADIATQEDVAESEVRLRLHLADPDTYAERGQHGSVRS